MITMLNYVQHNLQIEEDVLIAPKLHWAVYIDSYLQLSVLYILFCHYMAPFINYDNRIIRFFETTETVIWWVIVLRVVYTFFRNYSVEMAVTNYRVVYKIGIFNVHTEELVNSRIEAVSVRQSIMGKILNYGSIYFSGTGTSKVVFKKVYAPWWIKAQTEEIIRHSIEATSDTQQNYYNQQRRF